MVPKKARVFSKKFMSYPPHTPLLLRVNQLEEDLQHVIDAGKLQLEMIDLLFQRVEKLEQVIKQCSHTSHDESPKEIKKL